jgi:hypothetical protein
MGKKNSYLFGILLGIVIPVLLFGILYGLNTMTGAFSHGTVMLSVHKMMFVSIALNILPMRYYIIRKEVENTGKGILIITLILIIIVTVVL